MASGERKKIGKYEVLDILGRGGMGIVYKAVDPGIGRAVAIKMTTGAVGEDPEMLQRFSREAQSVGQLQHPNIVTVYDLGVEGRNPYLVMELLEGESLEALERSRRSLSLEEKLDITMQICAGVQYAHRRGVMHRDIKPANIMILKDGTAKIVDFGIARMGMQKLTRPGQLVGSFAYMSPEQINAAPVDARTDIFSIGVLLFELVAGRLPFEGKDTGEMLLKILHQAPPSLRELAPDCPAELEGMVQRALAKNVEERYQSAEDLGFDLGHVLEKWRRERVSEYLAGAETAAAQLKQQLTEKISILRESQLLQSAAEIADAKRTRPQLFEPTATSLKSVEPENTSAGGLQPAALPCEPPAPEPAEKLFATVAERDAAATSAPPADSLAVNRPLQSSNTAEPPAPQFPAESLPVPPANDSRRPPTGERIPQRMQPASFFVVGGTLRRDALSYIERAADETLYRALQAGEICYVLTARQMGKSSLMVRTAARLRESSARVAVLDLTGLGQNLTAEQWYNGLIERAGQQFNLEDEVDNCWRRFPQLGPMRRFMRVLSDVILPVAEDRIVIFIDEIDAVRSLSFSTDEFFAGIRECFNRRSSEPSIERLTFCLLGVATPSDLIRDTRTTPFNIGRRIELTDFTEHEAMPLAQGLGADDSAGSAIVRRVIYWTNGHPYLTQRLCQAVAQEKTRNPSTVDRLCQELFLSSRARDRDDNLLFVRERILRSEVDKAGLLTLYARILDGKAVRDEETNPLISVLRLSGITRVENGLLKVRSRIYKEVFNQDWATSNMPGAEVRRQRAAYKRGIKLALAITLPLLVIGMAVAYWNLYSVRNTIAERRFDTPKPPAFWASSRMPVAGAQSEIGGILLRTGQPDVTVLVDDFSFGRTSSSGDLRIPLPPASYNIRVEKQGFQALKLPVNVLKDQETQLNVKLQREVIVATSFVLTAAVPGAVVRFDGKEVGQVQSDGTFTHEASPGAHTIELDKTGYELFHTQQTFTLGEKSTIEARMQPSAEAAESSDYAAVADSTDPSQLRQFLQKHPNSKNAAQVRNRVEELDWKNVNTTDLASLDAFLQAHSQGQHANEARGLVAGLQKEQEECMVAMNSNNIEQLQSVVTKYPKSAYAEPARQKLSQLRDKVAVLSVMRRYEEAYNRKDLDGIVAVWPSCPYQKAYRDSFRSPEPQKLKLELEEPDIQGIMASVKGTGTRSGALSSSSSFTAKLIKQGDKWIIQSGIY